MLFQIAEGDGIAAEAPGQRLGVVQGAIGHDQAAHLRFGQVACGQLDGFAGADQEDAGVCKLGEDALGQAHGGERNRDRTRADSRIRADALGNCKGILEQAFQRRVNRVGCAGKGVGVLDLPQDLRFTKNHRLQPGGDAKQVADRIRIMMAVQKFFDIGAVQLLVVVQPAERCRFRPGIDVAVEFSAIAGGEYGGLANAGLRDQLGEGACGGIGGERGAFTQGHGGAQMIEP